ncbi:MAG TPA: hypothetical protein DHU59_03020 [Clostridiales bacterium]|nr:hypothetical protein [Clostridiales bacterium]
MKSLLKNSGKVSRNSVLMLKIIPLCMVNTNIIRFTEKQSSYMIIYQVDEDNNTVKIYRVLHGKRNTENFI